MTTRKDDPRVTTSNEYPYPCSRCGFCCVSEFCPAAILLGHTKVPCPMFTRGQDGTGTCGALKKLVDGFTSEGRPDLADVAREKFGIGKGCCTTATVQRGVVAYSFANLPRNIKISLAVDIERDRSSLVFMHRQNQCRAG